MISPIHGKDVNVYYVYRGWIQYDQRRYMEIVG